MTIARPGFERRVLSALDARPARIPVLVGGCGTGRTFLLRRLRERLGPSGCQYIDIERSATTPERLLRTVLMASPFTAPDVSPTRDRRARRSTPSWRSSRARAAVRARR
jgi:hypothetical protein